MVKDFNVVLLTTIFLIHRDPNFHCDPSKYILRSMALKYQGKDSIANQLSIMRMLLISLNSSTSVFQNHSASTGSEGRLHARDKSLPPACYDEGEVQSRRMSWKLVNKNIVVSGKSLFDCSFIVVATCWGNTLAGSKHCHYWQCRSQSGYKTTHINEGRQQYFTN